MMMKELYDISMLFKMFKKFEKVVQGWKNWEKWAKIAVPESPFIHYCWLPAFFSFSKNVFHHTQDKFNHQIIVKLSSEMQICQYHSMQSL